MNLTVVPPPVVAIADKLGPARAAAQLRELADKFDSGEVVDVAYVAIRRCDPGDRPWLVIYNLTYRLELIGAIDILKRDITDGMYREKQE